MTITAERAAHTHTAMDVDFVSPPPGFGPLTKFRLQPIEQAPGLYALRAVDADVRLFLLEPFAYDRFPVLPVPGYATKEIGAGSATEASTFLVANPTDEGIYVNLRAPIVVHRETGRAIQAIVEKSELPFRVLLDALLGN